ncbi:MAG: ArsR family transcriptional regulator, partial [Gammaproteobacteria bacterium]|nr:ArsR family transcriptional regulator [Gammaproteobacteria bacterium]
MSLKDIVTENTTQNIRLMILKALEEDPDYSHNDTVLQSILQLVGLGVSRDKLRTELTWLSEQGLITIEDNNGVMVAKLNARGEDVALGRSRVPGIAR